MSPVVLLAVGVVWGSVLTFAFALAYSAGRPAPPVDARAQEARAAEDLRPRSVGVVGVSPVRRRGDAA